MESNNSTPNIVIEEKTGYVPPKKPTFKEKMKNSWQEKKEKWHDGLESAKEEFKAFGNGFVLLFKDPRKGFKNLWTFIKSQKGWLFILPALILMAIFTFYPIVNSVILAFKQHYNALTNTYDGIGFSNFKDILTNNTSGAATADFGTCLVNTLLIALISVPASTLLALLISVWLNNIKVLQKAYQTIFFLPYLTNALAMGAVFATFFNVIGSGRRIDSYGLVNDIIRMFGGNAINWINPSQFGQAFNPWLGRFVVIIYSIWSGLPFKILILFSALQSVNKQYYDAAKIDGASKNTTLWKITVPLISPMISYLIVTGFIGGLKAYSSIVGIFGTSMGPADKYEMGTMVGYIYQCIGGNSMGYAAAGSLILFAIILVFTIINNQLSKRRVHY